jgi:hypothetical protein
MDLVLHVPYTARLGGAALAKRRTDALETALKAAEGGGPLARLFSLRHEFTSEWHRLVGAQEEGERSQKFALTLSRFPMIFRGRDITIKKVELVTVARQSGGPKPGLIPPRPNQEDVVLGDWSDLLEERIHRASSADDALDITVVDDPERASWELKLAADPAEELSGVLEDILVLVRYTVD